VVPESLSLSVGVEGPDTRGIGLQGDHIRHLSVLLPFSLCPPAFLVTYSKTFLLLWVRREKSWFLFPFLWNLPFPPTSLGTLCSTSDSSFLQFFTSLQKTFSSRGPFLSPPTSERETYLLPSLFLPSQPGPTAGPPKKLTILAFPSLDPLSLFGCLSLRI